jgi:hypothetical protein
MSFIKAYPVLPLMQIQSGRRVPLSPAERLYPPDCKPKKQRILVTVYPVPHLILALVQQLAAVCFYI